MPMVKANVLAKFPWNNLLRNDVLPTPFSPTTTTLKVGLALVTLVDEEYMYGIK